MYECTYNNPREVGLIFEAMWMEIQEIFPN
jgi:hypothetical protein